MTAPVLGDSLRHSNYRFTDHFVDDVDMADYDYWSPDTVKEAKGEA